MFRSGKIALVGCILALNAGDVPNSTAAQFSNSVNIPRITPVPPRSVLPPVNLRPDRKRKEQVETLPPDPIKPPADPPAAKRPTRPQVVATPPPDLPHARPD